MGPPPPELYRSIEEVGIINPVRVFPFDGQYHIVSGHHRVRLATRLGNTQIPAFILDPVPEDECLRINLQENASHRQYSDVEKGYILRKLKTAGINDGEILQQYMSWLQLERSKKVMEMFLEGTHLPVGLATLLHEMNVPLRVYHTITRWDSVSQSACEDLFSVLRPGVNKWRELVELFDETAHRDGVHVSDLLASDPIPLILQSTDLSPHEKFQRIQKSAFIKRYPVLSELKTRVHGVLDRLALDPKTRIKTPEHFENDEIKIELRFKSRDELVRQVEKLQRVGDSEALEELIRIFKEGK